MRKEEREEERELEPQAAPRVFWLVFCFLELVELERLEEEELLKLRLDFWAEEPPPERPEFELIVDLIGASVRRSEKEWRGMLLKLTSYAILKIEAPK